MRRLGFFTLAALILAAGCSNGNNANNQTQSAAQSSPPANAPATTGAESGSAVATSGDLPVYPGAVMMPIAVRHAATYCGHNIATSVYHVTGGDVNAVTDWYAGHVSGAVRVARTFQSSMGSGSIVQFFVPNGSGEAIVSGMHFTDPRAAAMMAAHGGAATRVVLTTYTPSLAPDDLRLVEAAYGNDGTAREQAMEQIRAKCGGSFAPPMSGR